jgi:hypothetical protein
MPPPHQRCPFQPCDRTAVQGHSHDYQPPDGGQRQCACGTRRWIINIGGGIPVQVACARCGGLSRINTMYERGRAEGPRRPPPETTSDPPF